MGQLMTRRSARNRGVSMIEVMVALAVLAFGLLGVAAVQVSALRATTQSRQRALAHELTQQQLEIFHEMSTTSFETIRAAGVNDPLNPIDRDPNDAQLTSFARTWAIAPDTPEDDVYTVMVTVAWTDARGLQRTVQLETFKSEL